MGRFFEARKSSIMARSDRMAKAFTRAGREIVIAVKAGGDNPDGNPSLRRAIQNARSVNMPKDKILAAVARAAGTDTEDYAEVLYEGYAPHGVAVMVVTTTDNTTRTVANVRMHFNKSSGNLGNFGAVSFLFERMGVFRLKPDGLDRDDLMLEMIDHGLERMADEEDDDGASLLVLRCAFNDFGALQQGLDEAGIEPVSTGSEFVPLTTMELDDESLDDVLKLIERLEADDDVQDVFTNLS
ncbi:MAG: YebC/PmpR family DNA-binding regulatory protein [Myxococcota bacterium]|jgi:YebC/PmpR family DNA-binding regulatory protein